MAFDKVIVFGPTGNIGSVVAQTASKKGAVVFLAMRDLKKRIPGLTKESEQSGNYQRVQADLNNADSIRSAVEESGAKAAFLYLAHGSPDNMLTTFQALKDGGIKNVVFLSSFSVPKDNLEDVVQSDMISYIHAQAELNLRRLFSKEHLVALRPGYFATNVVSQHKRGIADGNVKLLSPDQDVDLITNEDMGEVGGTVLVEGQRDGQDHIYLFGAEKMKELQAYQILGKVLGTDIKVTKVGPEEGQQELLREGLPEPVAKYLVKVASDAEKAGKSAWALADEAYRQGVKNVEKYTGHSPVIFEDWASRNKEMFV